MNAQRQQANEQRIQRALSDYEHIRLDKPFTIRENNSNGNTELFIHIPFTIQKPIEENSFYYLLEQRDRSAEQSFYEELLGCTLEDIDPITSFYVLDTTYSDYQDGYRLLENALSGTIQTDKTYYLVKWLTFNEQTCNSIPFSSQNIPWDKMAPLISTSRAL